MTTNGKPANGAIFDNVSDADDRDSGAVGVAAVRTPSASEPDRPLWAVMEKYAALIAEATPMRAVPLPLTQNEPAAVAARLSQLPSQVAVAFLIGVDPSDAADVQRAVVEAGGPPVISELDAVTAALAAAAVSSLRGRDITPRRGRIVVTGAAAAPRLGPLLIALGVGAITTWHPRDAQDYPLAHVMGRNDPLIDLAGTAPESAAPGRTLGLPSEPYDYGALVIPGLLRGLCRHEHATLTIEVLAACARAVAMVTTADQILPQLDQRLLIGEVALHVHLALSEDSRHRPLAHREPPR